MPLQISHQDVFTTSTENILADSFLLVILECIVAVFAMFKIANFLSTIKTLKKQYTP
jgi:hypothetical protein